MKRQEKIRRQLKDLRKACICQEHDVVLRKIAYAMEQAVRYATEDGIRGWETLEEQAKAMARLLHQELAK